MIILVGENNPYGGDPRYALYPEPEHSAGGRLCRKVLGLDVKTYLRTYDRRNLLQAPKWSIPAARQAAALMWQANLDSKFILLGRKVFDAFASWWHPSATPASQQDLSWTPLETYGGQFLALPHPSGLSRFWNEPEAFTKARDAVRVFSLLETT